MIQRPKRLLAVLLAGAALSGGCSGDSGPSAAPTTTAPAFRAEPPLPRDLNPIPYAIGDLVALRDLQVRVATVDGEVKGEAGASGTRSITLTLDVRNGALRPVSLRPGGLRLYDLRGESFVPVIASGPATVASGRTERFTLRYRVPAAATTPVLVVDGRAYPAGSVANGLIAIDPVWRPPVGDS
ncbi:MAG: hypothetical protein ACKOBG_08715 [Actinomycetota bacterium]